MFSLLLAIIYLIFVSLGLPDAVLGSAWPVMFQDLNVPLDYMGYIQIIISAGTIISSLLATKLINKMGTAKLTLGSVFLTAIALFGFAYTPSYGFLLLAALPYGLGAGAIDAALNNYVALHFESSHMSWLHSMWGVGASLGPLIMAYALARPMSWSGGYAILAIIQVVITFIIFLSLPLWQENKESTEEETENEFTELSLKDLPKVPGAISMLITFFSYTALENTVGLWASSYFVIAKGVSESSAAAWASLYYIGLTVGRMINGFLTYRFKDKELVRGGILMIAVALFIVIVSTHNVLILIGFILMGLGCAPIYPSVIHSVPDYFGLEKSQSIVSYGMASANLGILLTPALFGLIARYISIKLFPVYLALILLLMYLGHKNASKKTLKEA